jgi:2-polyprenyl-6-methoxyphenol hydroxylase-like FAD-dependent oxidoreductase
MSTSRNPLPFLIVGGGIGGVAAALALARQGFSSIVMEQAASFGEVGAGIQLGPNVFHAFDRLGVKDAMLEIAWLPSRLEMRDALTGEQITSVPVGDNFRAHFKAPYAVIHRADMHSTMLAAAEAQPLVSLRVNTRVDSFVDEGDRVSVVLADGTRVEGCALIGCDGLWSKVRAQVVGDGAPLVSGHIAYRAVLKREEVPEDLWHEHVCLWAGPKTHLVHYPLRRGELYNLVAVFHSDRYVEGWNSEGDPEELMRRFHGERPEVLRLLERIETWRMWVLCDREPVKNWTNGRITLLGDAAHPMLQYLAQGACMATEDAVRLADEVAATPDALNSAFLRYQDARYLRTGRVQTMARVYGEFYHAAGVKAELRKMVLGGRSEEASYKSMEWLYSY